MPWSGWEKPHPSDVQQLVVLLLTAFERLLELLQRHVQRDPVAIALRVCYHSVAREEESAELCLQASDGRTRRGSSAAERAKGALADERRLVERGLWHESGWVQGERSHSGEEDEKQSVGRAMQHCRRENLFAKTTAEKRIQRSVPVARQFNYLSQLLEPLRPTE